MQIKSLAIYQPLVVLLFSPPNRSAVMAMGELCLLAMMS